MPFHAVHGALQARILEWAAIPSSRGPRFVRSLHYDPRSLPTCKMLIPLIALMAI